MVTDIRQTKEYAKYLSLIGWHIEKINSTYCFIKKLPLLGTAVKIQRPDNLAEVEIKKIRKKYKPFQIIVEPSNQNQLLALKNQGFKISKSTYLPSKTLEIDLTRSEESIYEVFKKDAKYALRKSEKIEVKKSKNLENFYSIWKKSVPMSRYVMPLEHLKALKKSFKKKSLFLLVEDEAINAGAILLSSGDKVYYWQAFTSKKSRKSLVQYKIVWEGIKWSKKLGAKVFDFEGIYDSRFPINSWKGFTHFKESFGGKEIFYPGTFVKFNLFRRS